MLCFHWKVLQSILHEINVRSLCHSDITNCNIYFCQKIFNWNPVWNKCLIYSLQYWQLTPFPPIMYHCSLLFQFILVHCSKSSKTPLVAAIAPECWKRLKLKETWGLNGTRFFDATYSFLFLNTTLCDASKNTRGVLSKTSISGFQNCIYLAVPF